MKLNKSGVVSRLLHSSSRSAGGGGGELSCAHPPQRSSAMLTATLLLISCGILFHAYFPSDAVAGSDTVLWNATITSGVDEDGDTGWVTATSTGSIDHHSPTTDNMFVVNSATYTAKGLLFGGGVGTYFLVNNYIADSDRESLYITIENKRCSFSTQETNYGSNAYVWFNPPLARLFHDKRDTDVTILYNENYLTLNGNATVTVMQGDAYSDAGASTSDGVIPASNATNLDTTVPGNYTIQYTASKGCDVLDTAIRTVVVQGAGDETKPSFASAALDYDTREMKITFDEIINVTAADLTKMHVSDAGQSNEVSLGGADFNSTAPDSDTISMTLNQAQLSLIMAMETPQLDIEAGAVADLFENTINATSDNHILIFRAGSDTVLWNATITAGYDRNDQATGWDSRTELGGIAYHAPCFEWDISLARHSVHCTHIVSRRRNLSRN